MKQNQIKLGFVFKIIPTIMSIDKVLQRIQTQIEHLTPSLELFVDDNIQPSADDSERLQSQLQLLLETLAVYKYQKKNHEISPSFNIHAKVSEKQISEVPTVTAIPEIKQVVVEQVIVEKTVEAMKPAEILKPAEPAKPVEPVKVVEKTETEKPKQNLSIGLNDKFRFINELFSQNASEYNIAVEQLNNLRNWNDAEIYLNSLKSLYFWKEHSDVVKHFYSIVKNRF